MKEVELTPEIIDAIICKTLLILGLNESTRNILSFEEVWYSKKTNSFHCKRKGVIFNYKYEEIIR